MFMELRASESVSIESSTGLSIESSSAALNTEGLHVSEVFPVCPGPSRVRHEQLHRGRVREGDAERVLEAVGVDAAEQVVEGGALRGRAQLEQQRGAGEARDAGAEQQEAPGAVRKTLVTFPLIFRRLASLSTSTSCRLPQADRRHEVDSGRGSGQWPWTGCRPQVEVDRLPVSLWEIHTRQRVVFEYPSHSSMLLVIALGRL